MGKYQALTDYLAKYGDDDWIVSFVEIERLIGFDLPKSAFQHRTWWANSGGTQVHQNAWLSVGWRVANADPSSQTVTFKRHARKSDDEDYSMEERSIRERRISFLRSKRLAAQDNMGVVSVILDWRWARLSDADALEILPTDSAIVQLVQPDQAGARIVGQVDDLQSFASELEPSDKDNSPALLAYVLGANVVLKTGATERIADFDNQDELDLVELSIQTGLRMDGLDVLILT